MEPIVAVGVGVGVGVGEAADAVGTVGSPLAVVVAPAGADGGGVKGFGGAVVTRAGGTGLAVGAGEPAPRYEQPANIKATKTPAK